MKNDMTLCPLFIPEWLLFPITHLHGEGTLLLVHLSVVVQRQPSRSCRSVNLRVSVVFVVYAAEIGYYVRNVCCLSLLSAVANQVFRLAQYFFPRPFSLC